MEETIQKSMQTPDFGSSFIDAFKSEELETLPQDRKRVILLNPLRNPKPPTPSSVELKRMSNAYSA